MHLRAFAAAWLSLGLAGPVHSDSKTSDPRPKDDPYYGETKESRDKRMGWWREAKFGMFIHWGLYAVPAGTYQGRSVGGNGEWIMHDLKIPVADYAKFAGNFNPTLFNADEWVGIAADAGMKYIVITSKHHDGFAMFHTQHGNFSLNASSPYKRDPLKELAEACRKRGLKLGFYYSQNQDWHQPGADAFNGGWDPAQKGSMEKYLKEVAVPQVGELMTNYGPDVPAVLWWDTPGTNMTPEWESMFQPLLALKPGIITNNRLGHLYPGDIETPEQHIPPNGFPDLDWETCMTINNTWGYKDNDTDFKSTRMLIQNLIDIASKGGNYLLNVGPTATGVIPGPEVVRLKEMGAWLKKNGESIYGSKAGPFKTAFPWGRVTQKGKRLYVHVFDRFRHRLTLPMRNKASKARMISSATPVELSHTKDGAQLVFRRAEGDPYADVIAVDLGSSAVTEIALAGEPSDPQDGHNTRASGHPDPNLGYPSTLPGPDYFQGNAARNIISINFVGGANGVTLLPMAPGETAGVLRASHWNNAWNNAGSLPDLMDGSGAKTGAALSWDSVNTWFTPIEDRPGDNRMMKGYLDTSSNSVTKIKISRLPAAFTKRGYRVVVYFDGDGKERRKAEYSIGAVKKIVADPFMSVFDGRYAGEWDDDASKHENELIIEGQTSADFSLEARALDAGGEHFRAPINGFQIMAEP